MTPSQRFGLAFVPALVVFAGVNVLTPRYVALYQAFGAELPVLTTLYFRTFRVLALLPFAFVAVWYALPDSPRRGRITLVVSVVLSGLLALFALAACYLPMHTLCDAVC